MAVHGGDRGGRLGHVGLHVLDRAVIAQPVQLAVERPLGLVEEVPGLEGGVAGCAGDERGDDVVHQDRALRFVGEHARMTAERHAFHDFRGGAPPEVEQHWDHGEAGLFGEIEHQGEVGVEGAAGDERQRSAVIAEAGRAAAVGEYPPPNALNTVVVEIEEPGEDVVGVAGQGRVAPGGGAEVLAVVEPGEVHAEEERGRVGVTRGVGIDAREQQREHAQPPSRSIAASKVESRLQKAKRTQRRPCSGFT